MTTPPEPMPHVITARDQQWVELVAKVQADSDHLRDRLALAEARAASYENGITWQTTCLKCAETFDKSATIHLAVLEERDTLRSRLALAEQQIEAFNAVMPWPNAVGMYYRVLGERSTAERERDEARGVVREFRSELAIRRGDLAHWQGEFAKQKTEVTTLQERLALAEQALVDAGLREDRLRAVVTGYAVFLATRGLQDEADRFVEARSRLARLDETTPP